MYCVEGPAHKAFGLSITMPQKMGHHGDVASTITLVGDKDMVESLAEYLTNKNHSGKARPMVAGHPFRQDVESLELRRR